MTKSTPSPATDEHKVDIIYLFESRKYGAIHK